MVRFLEDLLVEFVLAGALTAFALGQVLIGFALLLPGAGLFWLFVRTRRRDSSGPSNTTATGL